MVRDFSEYAETCTAVETSSQVPPRKSNAPCGPKGVRVNLVAAGPVKTLAAKSIPGFARFEDVWDERSPLGWDVRGDAESVARSCVALLSDWFPKTTGEIVHVDGGFHAVAT